MVVARLAGVETRNYQAGMIGFMALASRIHKIFLQTEDVSANQVRAWRPEIVRHGRTFIATPLPTAPLFTH